MNKNLPTSLTSPQTLTVSEKITQIESDQKLRDQPNRFILLNAFVAEFMLMANISEQNKPSIEFQKILISNLEKYHNNRSIKEMHFAIELNINGKLSEKVDHYGKVTIEYFAEVFKLYDEKKRSAIHHEKTKYVAPVQPERKELPYHIGRPYYIELEKWVKTTGSLPLFWDWSKCYQFLLDDGQLTDFPKSRMIEIFERFKSKGMSEATVGRFAFQDEKQLGKMIGFDQLSKDDNVKHECRKYVVQEFLIKKFEIQKNS